MVGDDPPKTTMIHAYHPALSATNFKALIPLVLDVDNVKYTPWATLFRNMAKVYMVLDHINPKVNKSKDIDDDLCDRLDAIVLQWLYGTISKEFFLKVLDNNAIALEIWNRLREIFQDNRGTLVVLLENKFGNIRMSKFSSLDEYCQSLKTVVNQLAALNHHVSAERLALQLVGNLDAEYRTIATIILQTNPLPSLGEACSTLDLERLICISEKDDNVASLTLLVAGNTHKAPLLCHNRRRTVVVVMGAVVEVGSLMVERTTKGRKSSRGSGKKILYIHQLDVKNVFFMVTYRKQFICISHPGCPS